MPEIIYKFENQNLLPYEDNLNFKGDFHLRHNFILGQLRQLLLCLIMAIQKCITYFTV